MIEKLSKDALVLFRRAQGFLALHGFSSLARDYLERRGIPIDEVGFIPEDMEIKSSIRKLRFPFYDRMEDRLFGRLLFKDCLPNGQILGFSSSSIVKKSYLHMSLDESIPFKALMYGAEREINQMDESLFITEGIPDAEAFYSIKRNAVALLGTTLSFQQAAMIVAIANDIVLAFDADDAGYDAIHKAAIQLAAFDVVPRVAIPPHTLDPDDTIRGGRAFTYLTLAGYYNIMATDKKKEQILGAYASSSIRDKLSAKFVV